MKLLFWISVKNLSVQKQYWSVVIVNEWKLTKHLLCVYNFIGEVCHARVLESGNRWNVESVTNFTIALDVISKNIFKNFAHIFLHDL